MSNIDRATYKKAICQVFGIPWVTAERGGDWDTTNTIAAAFISEELDSAEGLKELHEEALPTMAATYQWSQIMIYKMRKLLDWMRESRRTTAQWADLTKEQITSRPLPASATTPTGTGTANRSFFGDASVTVEAKRQDIKLDLKTMTELKNDRKYCAFMREFKQRLRSDRLDYLLSDEYNPPGVDEAGFAEYKYHCSKVLTALSYCCKTPMSKLIIRKHIDEGDARACLEELDTVFKDGMSRKLELRAADKELRDFHLEPSYSKSIVAWMTTWASKEQNYNDYASNTELLPDATKRQILERAVSDHPQMVPAINMVLLEESKSKIVMGWKDFWDFLLNYALQIDTRRGTDAPVTRRRVNQAEQQAQPQQARVNNTQVNGRGNNQRSGRGNGSRNSGRGGGRGCGAGRGNGGWQPSCASTQTIEIPSNVNASIPPDTWRLLTWDQQNEVRERRQQGANNRQVNTTQQAPTAPTIATQATPASTASVATPRTSNTQRGSAIQQFMSSNQPAASHAPSSSTRRAFVAESRQYKVAALNLDTHAASTVDRGASGGVWGADGRVISEDKFHKIEVTGVGGLKLPDLSTVTAVAKLKSTKGWVIGEFHNYAYTGTGKSIHSSMQMEAFGLDVNDKHHVFGGGLRIDTPNTPDGDGYTFMLGMEGGMATLPMYPVTNHDLRTLPRVMMTHDGPWDPSVYDVQPAAAEDEDDDNPPSDDDDDEPVPELLPRNASGDDMDDSDDDESLPDLISGHVTGYDSDDSDDGDYFGYAQRQG